MCGSLFLASLDRQEQTTSPCQPRLSAGPAPRRRPRKRRPIYKVAPLSVSSTRRAINPLKAVATESGKSVECEKQQDASTPNSHQFSSIVTVLPSQNDSVTGNNTHNSVLNHLREPPTLEVTYMLVCICLKTTYVCNTLQYKFSVYLMFMHVCVFHFPRFYHT